jgi:hypothetical protein
VIEQLYNTLRNDRELMTFAKQIAGDKWEDVVQEIGIVLCAKTEPELQKLIPYYRFWCIRTMSNMISPTGIIGRKESKIDRNVDVTNLFESLQDTDASEDIDTAKQANVILDTFTWYERELFREYALQGSLRKVSLATKIPLMSVHQTVYKVKTIIKKKLK